MRRRFLRQRSKVVRVLLLGLFIVAATTMYAQEEDALDTRTFIYSAKFVCKNAGIPATDVGPASTPSVYRTVINLHNLHAEPVGLVIRAVEARGLNSTVPGASGRIEKRLKPGEAVFIGCNAIQEILGGVPDVHNKVDGFVTVASKRRLDAAAVYSAVTRSPIVANDGVAIDVERLRPKIVWRDGTVEEE